MMLEARPVRQTSGTEHRTMSPTTEFETRGAAEISQPVGVETRLASEVKQLLADGQLLVDRQRDESPAAAPLSVGLSGNGEMRI